MVLYSAKINQFGGQEPLLQRQGTHYEVATHIHDGPLPRAPAENKCVPQLYWN